MEYQKIVNLLNNAPGEPFKFGTKSRVEVNDDLHGTYNSKS